MTLAAPFPWFGGKSRVAALVWERLWFSPACLKARQEALL